MAANGQPNVTILNHEGVANVVIDQDNISRLMEGAQQIEAATSNVNDTTALDAVRTLMGMMAMVVRVLVRLIVDFSSHIGNVEVVVENRIVALQGQARATYEAAKSGYEEITKKIDSQSMEMPKVITGAQDSFEAIKQEREAIKTISEIELTII